MPKYRKKPIVIDAVLWDGSEGAWNAIQDMGCVPDQTSEQDTFDILITTLEGVMTAKKGDYIIKGIKGEFYPCKPDIFEATYEPDLIF